MEEIASQGGGVSKVPVRLVTVTVCQVEALTPSHEVTLKIGEEKIGERSGGDGPVQDSG